ncbi:MAG: helix-turn-helix domain-containing protein [Alphaproteobacteria bacterium]|nr:helix-turn-helix domain-containing protein [Alphaproteobacteria bacterium]
MGIHSHHLLKEALAPLLAEERQKRNMLPEQVAMACDLSVENINRIETGARFQSKNTADFCFIITKR